MKTTKINFIYQRSATILSLVILTLAIVAAITGIIIGFNYQPAAGDAYKSLSNIANNLNYGWLLLSLHNWAGNGIIVVSLIQIIIIFLGRQFRTSWLTSWISGILLTLTTIGLGWTAMILGWNQLGYWRLKVELEIISSIPLIGETIANILTGGGGINTTTIEHFYTIHGYVLSLGAIALSTIHLLVLIVQEQEQKGILVTQLERLFVLKNQKQEEAKQTSDINI